MEASEFYNQMQERFDEGKIKCSCGNSDWRQFLYIAVGDEVHAGCKRCGGLQKFDSETKQLPDLPAS